MLLSDGPVQGQPRRTCCPHADDLRQDLKGKGHSAPPQAWPGGREEQGSRNIALQAAPGFHRKGDLRIPVSDIHLLLESRVF